MFMIPSTIFNYNFNIFRHFSNIYRININITKIPIPQIQSNSEYTITKKENDIIMSSAKSRASPRYKSVNIPKALRIGVWNRWVGSKFGTSKCYVCNYHDIYATHYECGHVISRKNGGKDTIDNLRPICRSCNLSMSTQNLEIFKKKYFSL
jgi:5-methylcytosine-specific restriction endonuclease McrA